VPVLIYINQNKVAEYSNRSDQQAVTPKITILRKVRSSATLEPKETLTRSQLPLTSASFAVIEGILENTHMADTNDTGSPALDRPTSFAYASASSSSSLWNIIEYHARVKSRGVLVITAFILFVLVLSSNSVQPPSGNASMNVNISKWSLRGNKEATYFGGAYHSGYFDLQDSIIDDNSFRFAAITDLDQLSRKPNSRKMTFQSMLLPGLLTRNPKTNMYAIQFEKSRMLYSQHNEGGRGMELSELTLYNNRLLAFDDRTGTVFEILNKDKGKGSIVVPRLVITEGNGDTDKGMKWEWASVKGDELYMGSMGKEYTNPDGSVANTNNQWIAIVDVEGRVRRKNWSKEYNFVRKELDANFPGYVMHEAVLWSEHIQKWIFIPRRVSHTEYEENEDERRGSNKLILVDEHFKKADVLDIKFDVVDPLHGFSTFAFIPGTNDRHALAIRSVEENCVGGDEAICKQSSYFTVFDITTGDVLMDEVELKLDTKMKFEGVEFVNIHTVEPY